MQIVIDFSQLFYLAQERPFYFIWYIFKEGGWIAFAVLFVYFFIILGRLLWLNSRQSKYFASWEFVLLAIDVPKVNLTGPKSVEHLFSTIAGAHSSPSFPEKWLKGKFQETFSFEIISVGGYIQFLIRTTKHFRNLVESAIYSQYPDAEIVEVEDYTSFAPDSFPDDEYDMWGTEIALVKDWAYPIRTYPHFEDPIEELGERKFKDPMAAMMEVMSRLGPGENLWYQIIVEPTSQDWAAHSKSVANRLLGRKASSKRGFLFGEIRQWLFDLWYVLFSVLGGESKTTEDITSSLSGGEKKVVDAIEEKAAKTGFNAKIRFIYIAKHAVMNKPLGVSGFFGSLKQYNTVDMNAFKPNKKFTTSAVYGNVKKRIAKKQQKIMANYKTRALYPNPYVLNIEELASLYHFPVAQVRNIMIKTADIKRIGAPTSLPVADSEEEQVVEELVEPNLPKTHLYSPQTLKSAQKDTTQHKKPGTTQNAPTQIRANKTTPKAPMNLPIIE